MIPFDPYAPGHAALLSAALDSARMTFELAGVEAPDLILVAFPGPNAVEGAKCVGVSGHQPSKGMTHQLRCLADRIDAGEVKAPGQPEAN